MIYPITLVHTIDAKNEVVLNLITFQCGRLPELGEQIHIQINNEEWMVEVSQITTLVAQRGNSFMLEVEPVTNLAIEGLKKELEKFKPKKKKSKK